jgi:DNA-binding CsgD family transcriptional regulator
MRRGRRPHADILTPREWEVLKLIKDGLTNEQIGERLGISLAGARYHVSEILSKLGVASRREAADWLLAWQSEQAGARRLPAVLPSLAMLFRRPELRWFGRWTARAAIAGGLIALVLLSAVVLVNGGPDRDVDEVGQPAEPTPAEHVAVDFSQPTLGARYVTEWDLPEVPSETPLGNTNASGIEAALPHVIAATLRADAAAVRRSGAGFGAATLHEVRQDHITAYCQAVDLCFWTVPLAQSRGGGEYWAVVSGGRANIEPGSPLGLEIPDVDSAAPVFAHFVAVYERRSNGSWSSELSKVLLADPRGDCCVLVGVTWGWGGAPFSDAGEALSSDDPSWRRLEAAIDEGIAGVAWDVPGQPITSLPAAAGQPAARSGWLTLRGTPFMATAASVFYALRFDVETETITVVESNLHRRWAGDIRGLDGDGTPAILINESDAYVFSGASGTEETFVRLLRWEEGELVDVPFEAPSGLSDDLTTRVNEALRFADAGLWTDAAELIGGAANEQPGNQELRWLARRVQLITLGRLLQAERQEDRGANSLQAPLLVMTGEYEAVVELMRQYSPDDLFGTAGVMHLYSAPEDSNSMLQYSSRALSLVAERAAVHAVRAWSFALALPSDVESAEASMAEAVRLAPEDAFYAEALEWLRANSAE